MEEIKVESIHSGQYKPYGDSFYVWKLETDINDEQTILDYCHANFSRGNKELPSSGEWHKNIRFGGEKSGDANYYFTGYYSLTKRDYGWEFKICEPYTG